MSESRQIGEVFVEHAARLWKAETDVAERYAARVRTLVTLATSMLGGTLLGLGATLLKLSEFDPAFGLGGRIAAAGLAVLSVLASGYFLLKVPILLLRSLRYPDEAKAIAWQSRVADSAARQEGATMAYPTASYQLSLPEEFLDWVAVEADPDLFVAGTQLLKGAEDLRTRNRREKHRLQAGELAMTSGLRTSLVTLAILMGLIGVSFVMRSGAA